MKFLVLLTLGWILSAQDRPQFVWQGEVDGIVILHLRDNRLDVQIQEGAPVGRQQFHFYDRLPEIRQNVRLDIRESRGYVHILDQPNLENRYTLALAIEDRQTGSSRYSIALYWDASARFFEGSHRPGKTGQITWSGHVDGEAIISCHAKTCVSSVTRGAPVSSERFKFSRVLPERDLDLALDEAQGRGEIRLVEQPRKSNNYTARISIHDPQAGSGEYAFTLAWTLPSAKEPQLTETPVRGLVWSGVVDAVARVTVQGGSALSEALEGRPITGERADFLRPLPERADLTPVVKKNRGRGDVEIVEYPSPQNHFRLVFEIHNPNGVADNYEIEVDW